MYTHGLTHMSATILTEVDFVSSRRLSRCPMLSHRFADFNLSSHTCKMALLLVGFDKEKFYGVMVWYIRDACGEGGGCLGRRSRTRVLLANADWPLGRSLIPLLSPNAGR